MSEILVIGYGNTLRGDDAAGIQAAELLGKRTDGIDVILVPDLSLELARPMSQCEHVIFVDACTGGAPFVSRTSLRAPFQKSFPHIQTPRGLCWKRVGRFTDTFLAARSWRQSRENDSTWLRRCRRAQQIMSRNVLPFSSRKYSSSASFPRVDSKDHCRLCKCSSSYRGADS